MLPTTLGSAPLTCEALDLALTCLLVQALGVTLLTDTDGHLQQDMHTTPWLDTGKSVVQFTVASALGKSITTRQICPTNRFTRLLFSCHVCFFSRNIQASPKTTTGQMPSE